MSSGRSIDEYPIDLVATSDHHLGGNLGRNATIKELSLSLEQTAQLALERLQKVSVSPMSSTATVATNTDSKIDNVRRLLHEKEVGEMVL